MSPSDFHEASRQVKLMVIEELVAALEDDPHKIVTWEIESTHGDLTFYKLGFSLSGEAQFRIDRAAVESGLWAMGPAPKESS
jgi:hypothetical protein